MLLRSSVGRPWRNVHHVSSVGSDCREVLYVRLIGKVVSDS